MWEASFLLWTLAGGKASIKNGIQDERCIVSILALRLHSMLQHRNMLLIDIFPVPELFKSAVIFGFRASWSLSRPPVFQYHLPLPISFVAMLDLLDCFRQVVNSK